MNKCDMKWMSLTEMHKKKKFHVKLIHLNKGKFDDWIRGTFDEQGE